VAVTNSIDENHEYLEKPKCTSDWEVQVIAFITLLIKGTDCTNKNKDRYYTAAVTMAHIRLVKSGYNIVYNATRPIQVNSTSLAQPVVTYIIITNTGKQDQLNTTSGNIYNHNQYR
jgi:hypothetical protein